MRGTRASSCSVRPSLRAATIRAPSVGSPCTFQRPSLSVSAASLTSAAARSVRVDGRAHRRVRRERLAVAAEPALGTVAAAADLDQRAAGRDRAHRHLVAGQRAGLVGADHGGGAERLDRRQLAHDRMRGRHAPHAEAQAHGDDRRQRFRDRRDRERHREQEQAEHDVERQRRGAEQAGREHHRADAEHHDGEAACRCGRAPAAAASAPSRRPRACRRCVRPRFPCRSPPRRRGRGRRSRRCRNRACCCDRRGSRRPRPASELFATGRLSPVSGASSVCRLASSMMRASAGILSPASISTMSPGTISCAPTRWRSPSRTTVDSGAASAIRARTERSARASWKKPSSALSTTMAVMTIAS